MPTNNTTKGDSKSPTHSSRIGSLAERIKILLIVILSSVLLNCSSNRMGLFDNSQKPKTEMMPQKSQDIFKVVSFEGDSLPAVGMFNERLAHFAEWTSYPWNCSVVVRCKEVNDIGLPTDAEASILNNFEDSLGTRIVADESHPNALFFGRLNWNSTRELIWKVKNPEPVAAFLQSVIDDKNAIRGIDFKMEYDKEWKMTQIYSDAINKKKP